MSIPVSSNIAEVEKEIHKHLSELKSGTDPSNVFVITRRDLVVEKDSENYHRLLAYLESEFGQPAWTHKLGLLLLSKYRPERPNQ